MATINFIVSGNRIATESFTIGKIYEIIFTNGNFLICACNHIGNNFVVFQRELPELLFTLNMETASSVRSIEETGGGGGTYNYNSLENKPQINSVELSGNKSSSDLGLQSALDISQLDAINSGITAAKVTSFEAKQDAITSSNKLSADLVDDATTTNKFVTTAEKTTWNAKQNALTFDDAPTQNSSNPVKSGGIYTELSGKQDTIDNLATIESGAAAGATAVQPAAMEAALAQKQDILTTTQLAAVNSGITLTDVEQIGTNKNNILLKSNAENTAYKTAATSFGGTNMQCVFNSAMFTADSRRGSVLMMFGTQKASVNNTLLMIDFNDTGIRSIRRLSDGTSEVITAIGAISSDKQSFAFTADGNSYTYPCLISMFANKDIKPNFTIVEQT